MKHFLCVIVTHTKTQRRKRESERRRRFFDGRRKNWGRLFGCLLSITMQNAKLEHINTVGCKHKEDPRHVIKQQFQHIHTAQHCCIECICYTWKFDAYAFMIVISTQLIRPCSLSLHACIHIIRLLFLFCPLNSMFEWGCSRPCNCICCLNMWNLLWYSRCSTSFFHNRRRCRRCCWYNSKCLMLLE